MPGINLKCSDLLNVLNEKSVAARLIGENRAIESIEPIESCCKNSLTFAEKQKYLDIAVKKQVAAVVVPNQLIDETVHDTCTRIVVDNVRVALALIRQRFDDCKPVDSQWPRVHPSAVIHDSVIIPDSAMIGPCAVIGAHVTLSERTVVMANAVIESQVRIGSGTVIHPGCIIGWNCEIGADVIIKSGAVIGAEGHGFARDETGRFHRIPQRGKVVIEDQVVIGANCTIDRATYHETRVHRGCIIDAQCHLAHNVVLDEDCALVAQTGIAGSSRFGKRVMASGQTGVLDHVTIPDDTVLVHRAGVINSIKQSGMYATTPPQPFSRYLKNIAVFQRLSDVWERLRKVEKAIAQISTDRQG
ncbi:MAG: UDP-3-O-(3-hydroxymyristoyl)glucosamine N-acyltransferase [Gammaproteobacteria bacterium]|nr:UDP-3-O-(3-hydroxymyristoyl)glucosamine N-acyltransferase [Gammaproteobacteria bacterium]